MLRAPLVPETIFDLPSIADNVNILFKLLQSPNRKSDNEYG